MYHMEGKLLRNVNGKRVIERESLTYSLLNKEL